MARRRRDYPQEFGRGLYSLTELSQLLSFRGLGASPVKVLRWIQDGLVESPHQEGAPTYSFHDLISLLVVASLRSRGVKLSAVRAAEVYMREERGIPRPFATEDIYTDGFNVLVKANPEIADQLTAANLRGQEVMRKALGIALKGVGYADQIAAWWDLQPHVRIRPEIQFGAPCLVGTRVLTSHLYALHRAGDKPQRLASLYELPTELVAEAVSFETELAKAA